MVDYSRASEAYRFDGAGLYSVPIPAIAPYGTMGGVVEGDVAWAWYEPDGSDGYVFASIDLGSGEVNEVPLPDTLAAELRDGTRVLRFKEARRGPEGLTAWLALVDAGEFVDDQEEGVGMHDVPEWEFKLGWDLYAAPQVIATYDTTSGAWTSVERIDLPRPGGDVDPRAVPFACEAIDWDGLFLTRISVGE
jgi:hypothetical protein